MVLESESLIYRHLMASGGDRKANAPLFVVLGFIVTYPRAWML